MFDLARLTEFNHALIYGLEADPSPESLLGATALLDVLFPSVAQYYGMLNAYLYVQSDILPRFIDITRHAISHSEFLEWIKMLHGYMSSFLPIIGSLETERHTDDTASYVISDEMGTYVAKTLAQFREINAYDLDQVSLFLAESFYQLAQIHPFGNGRVAICVMNIFLRGFGLPSILLCYPGDKTNEESAYSRAIAQIPVSRTLLQELIKSQIIAAQQSEYSNDDLNRVMHQKIELVGILKRIQERRPTYNLDKIKIDSMRTLGLAGSKVVGLKRDVLAMRVFITIATQEEQKLEVSERSQLSLVAVLTVEQRTLLKQGLCKFSGHDTWKITQRKGVSAWIEMTDIDEAGKIEEKLNAADIAEQIMITRADHKSAFVVKCVAIKYQKLLRDSASVDAAEVYDIQPQ